MQPQPARIARRPRNPYQYRRMSYLFSSRRPRVLRTNDRWVIYHRPRHMSLWFSGYDIDVSQVVSLAGPSDALNCSWCGGPAEPRPGINRGEALCVECLAAWLGGSASLRKGMYIELGTGRRGRYTGPAGDPSAEHRLRESRMRPAAMRTKQCPANIFIGMWPRPRSRYTLRASTLRYLSRRRSAAAECRRRGFERINTGIWYDRAADVVYVQTATIYPIDNVRRAVA